MKKNNLLHAAEVHVTQQHHGKTRKFFAGFTALLLSLMLTATGVNAQTYQFDHMSTYQISGSSNTLINHAIKKDDLNNKYYIVQSIIQQGYSLVISEVDDEFNILNLNNYVCTNGAATNTNMYITPYDINFYGNRVIVVGRYIEEGVDAGGFMFCANKNTGAFMWFQKYPDIYTLASVVTSTSLGGCIAVGHREVNNMGQYSTTTGVAIRTDNFGNVVWMNDVDHNKYVGTGLDPLFNELKEVIQISSNPDMFAAVGSINNFLNFTFQYSDGDGALVTFDENGNFSSQLGLGNIAAVTVNPGPQNLQHDRPESIALCSDGDVILAGAVLELPDTYMSISCKTSTPDYAGVWVTKINPYTGTVAWSTVYDYFLGSYAPPAYPIIDGVGVVNDGTDNFAVKYHDWTNNYMFMMKVDINGSQIYSRKYTHPWGPGYLFDLTPAIGTTDILATGVLRDIPLWDKAWNVAAYDNILDYCHSEDAPLMEFEHPYEVFNINTQQSSTTLQWVDFVHAPLPIDRFVDCEKQEAEDDGSGGKTAMNNEAPTISQEAQTGDIMILIPDMENYGGVLINGLGQEVLKFNNITNGYRISAQNIATGIYYLHINNGKKQVAKPIIIQ